MALLAADLGGTKLALAIFSEQGEILFEERVALGNRAGEEVGLLICEQFRAVMGRYDISAAGICVPGIYHKTTGRVWAPNIGGWTDYPLQAELEEFLDQIPVCIDSDRACYILGEYWKGAAQGCKDAIYLAVGTGIGAGIMAGGQILRGGHDIAGAIGWMALERPFHPRFAPAGCFEGYASGTGMALHAQKLMEENVKYNGALRQGSRAEDVFKAYETGDEIAVQVINNCIELWGMAMANLVSLFDPEKIILGGGVFGPGVTFIPRIVEEAAKWAQPVSMKLVQVEASMLQDKAGVYGAGMLAQKAKQETGV
jgi:glucokinase